MSNSRNIRRKKKKRRSLRLFFLTILLVLIGGGSYFAYDIVYNAKKASDNIYQELDSSKITKQRKEEVQITKDAFNILLVGIEDQGGGERSDVLMLVTVNPESKEVYMLSIPRDTKTYLPDAGYTTKITHSYSNGGIESTIETVSELLDVPIDYYVTTNFQGFEDIVDTLGGVSVEVPFTFKAQLTDSLRWKTYYEGPMDLNGNEALAYVRMRKKDPKGDMGRNERQQQVIKAIVDKGTSFSSLSKIDDVMHDLGENVKTNIPPSKFLSFINLYTKIKNTQIQNLAIEGYDEWIDSVYYYTPYDESISELSSILNNALDTSSYSVDNHSMNSNTNQAAGSQSEKY
ncbi:LCP family protein [Cytobacillus sp. FJAT-54145]|uniref:LCP family protein n=1 Tax=Cytobacillus spartinae TaxID=3299023 RepID=A0ABW6KC00_9BACI